MMGLVREASMSSPLPWGLQLTITWSEVKVGDGVFFCSHSSPATHLRTIVVGVQATWGGATARVLGEDGASKSGSSLYIKFHIVPFKTG